MFGEERDTDDIEGKVVKQSDYKPDLSEVKTVLKQFRGELSQIPPSHSAIKIKGKKAYELARADKTPELKARKVLIKQIKLMRYTYPRLNLRFEVGSGTYIRALARDIGRELGCYGYLANLRRTKVGDYKVKNAKKIEDLF